MARPEVTGRKPKSKDADDTTRQRRDLSKVPPDSFTVQEFCDRHRISRSKYYELREKGLTPDEMNIDGITRISVEAAARWRAEREATANTV